MVVLVLFLVPGQINFRKSWGQNGGKMGAENL